jgi:glutamine phosphoribosylpyrophosphate amidotransferase
MADPRAKAFEPEKENAMCGIAGFYAIETGLLDTERWRQIMLDIEDRGPHAFGFAWLDAEGLGTYKRPGRLSDHPQAFDLVDGSGDAR